MKKIVFALVWFVFALVSTGCATSDQRPKFAQKEWVSSLVPGVSSTYDKPLLQEHRGTMFQIRYGAKSKLMIRNLQTGKDVVIMAGAPDDLRLDGIATYSDGKKMYVAWRPKLDKDNPRLGKVGDKMVYVATSDDGETFSPPSRISDSDGAFMPAIAGSGQGDAYVVWQDERAGSRYDLYFNFTHDGGRTWKEKDLRIDVGNANEFFSAEPSIRAEGNRVWITWTESTPEGFIVFVRSSSDKGETWNQPAVLVKQKKQALYPQLVKINSGLAAYWFDQDAVYTARSTDHGVTWSDATKIVDVAPESGKMQEMHIKTDNTGYVHVIYGKKSSGDDDRSNLYHIGSSDGVVFTPAIRLNSGKEHQASAILPSIATSNNGEVMVAWMDYRYFRPVVMASFSSDQGKTWSQNRVTDDGPATGASQFPVVTTTGGQWWQSLIRYDTETMADGRVIVSQFDPRAVPPSEALDFVDTNKLKGRVNTWWASRVNADWSTSYDMADPFVRARTEKARYLASQGSVKYYDYKIVGVEMLEPRKARVKMSYTSEVPELELNGKKIAVPKRETETTQDWIWVDGNWFLLFKDLYGKTFLDF